jgi:hypothetical protein
MQAVMQGSVHTRVHSRCCGNSGSTVAYIAVGSKLQIGSHRHVVLSCRHSLLSTPVYPQTHVGKVCVAQEKHRATARVMNAEHVNQQGPIGNIAVDAKPGAHIMQRAKPQPEHQQPKGTQCTDRPNGPSESVKLPGTEPQMAHNTCQG